MTSADLGRAAVYAAETAAFDGTRYESLVPFAELVALVDEVTDTEWWPHGPILVDPARSDARSSSTSRRATGHSVIRLAGPQCTPATAIHELAHVLAGVENGHGPTFRRAYLDLVGACFGTEEMGWLRTAFDDVRLSVGQRSWPQPPLTQSEGDPIAL